MPDAVEVALQVQIDDQVQSMVQPRADTRQRFVRCATRSVVRESRYWLSLISEASLRGRRDVTPLLAEANELVAILTASAKTAKRESPSR